MVKDYESTIQYIEQNLRVESIGTVIIIALILLMVIGIILFAFRKVRLWYWKINDQMDALANIDKSLEEIKKNMPEKSTIESVVTSITAVASMPEKDSKKKTPLKEEPIIEAIQVNTQAEAPKIVFDKKDKDERTIIKHGYNIGKTGKIYAEEVLREQIQF